ncbi:hypothetical protein [Allorhizocola rhizosphaerae]|uniref:hypothetical protein n=1 Tax=Allorhizocola rhizosphaerae TaxID=1872709 RepID=UPI000E3EC52D|nr:hypothetical protein [Allorhizocola rhizosphaerae]
MRAILVGGGIGSARTGRISSGLRNPVAAALRDTAIRLMSARAALRNIAKIASWSMDPLGSSTE